LKNLFTEKRRQALHDVVTLGEAMLRLVPPDYQRLEQADSFRVTVGGAELSVAANVARLGLGSAWVSKLPENPMGRMIANKAREQGVDTSHVVWSRDGRAGLYFVEFGCTPRPTAVFYDRKDSAASMLGPGEIDWGKVLKQTRLFHTSGITPALSQSCRDATIEAIEEAGRAGCKTSFDLNFRAKLWSAAEAKACFETILERVDILITTRFDAGEVLGYAGSNEDIVKKLSDDFRIPVVAMTVGSAKTVRTGTLTGLVWAEGKLYTDDVAEIEVVDRFGVGDSFTAGLLYGYLTDGIERGLKIGDAMAALKFSIPGDINWVTLDDIERFLDAGSLGVQR